MKKKIPVIIIAVVLVAVSVIIAPHFIPVSQKNTFIDEVFIFEETTVSVNDENLGTKIETIAENTGGEIKESAVESSNGVGVKDIMQTSIGELDVEKFYYDENSIYTYSLIFEAVDRDDYNDLMNSVYEEVKAILGEPLHTDHEPVTDIYTYYWTNFVISGRIDVEREPSMTVVMSEEEQEEFLKEIEVADYMFVMSVMKVA